VDVVSVCVCGWSCFVLAVFLFPFIEDENQMLVICAKMLSTSGIVVERHFEQRGFHCDLSDNVTTGR